MKRLLGTFAVLLVLSPLAAVAQDRSMLPKGRWWKMPEVAKRLNISAEQQGRLDTTFTQRSKELIDLKAAMDKAAIELRASLERFDTDPSDVLAHANAVGEARNNLFSKEIEMMLDIRAELNEEQWTQVRTAIDERMQEQRPRDLRRPIQQQNPPRQRQNSPRRP